MVRFIVAVVVVLSTAAVVGAGCSATGDVTTTTDAATTTTTGGIPPASATTNTTADLAGADLVALLTPEDVQTETGLVDVRRAGRNPERRLGGDLNFVRPDGQPLLMVVVQPGESYEDWKADPDSFRQELDGLGEAAFVGPSTAMNEEPYLVVFQAGSRTVGLLTYDDPETGGWTNLLTMDQLQALARVIIGRL